MRYAIVKDGVVVNALALDDPEGWPLGDGEQLIATDEGSPGDTWDGVKFTRPDRAPDFLPVDAIGPAQARIALYQAGLLDKVEAKVASAEYPPVRIYFDNAAEWRRDHPYIQGLAMDLGLTDDQVDNLFRAAARL